MSALFSPPPFPPLSYFPVGRQTHRIEYHPDHERATRTHGNVLAVPQVVDQDLEFVAAWARVGVDLEGGVVGHVLCVCIFEVSPFFFLLVVALLSFSVLVEGMEGRCTSISISS